MAPPSFMRACVLALALAVSAEALLSGRVAPRPAGARMAPAHAGRSAVAAFAVKPTKYAEELVATAQAMVAEGKGLLACDESTGTVGKRLESIGQENTEENRKRWRSLLFNTKDLGQYVSGAILFEETLFQDDLDGTPFVDVLRKQGIIPGIKVDTGLKPLAGGIEGETWCSGLDDLATRAAKFYERGARFAKWRTAVRIDTEKGMPSDLAVQTAAQGLAHYARICQEHGLVPIVEPETLIDGTHDVETAARIQEHVVSTVYKACIDAGVLLEGSLLKPSMTAPGIDCPDKSDPATIARLTVQTLERSVPAAVPGVTFLSGGISEEDSSIYLSEINKIERKGPWALTFSFSRALQSSCLKMWNGEDENLEAAQAQLLARAQANSEASRGEYKPGSQPSSEESLFVSNYVY